MALLRKTILLLALLSAASIGAPQSSYRVIVNRANAATTLDRTYASRLFLKKVSAWPDGRAVAVVDQERQSPARQAFSREVHQRDADSVAAYWQTQVFAGRDVPPPIAKSDADVIAFVQTNPGAIGYVSADADTGGVKVLTVR